MWICLNDSFLSIVDKGDPSGATLLVRARRDLRHPNFKSSVREPRRHRVYAELWAVLARDEDPLPR